MGFFDKLFGSRKVVAWPESEKHGYLHGKLNSLAHNVVRHFNNVREDIGMQKKWVEYLHSMSQKIQKQHNAHKELTQKDINNIRQWVKYLHSVQEKQDKDIKELGANIKQVLGALSDIDKGINSKIQLEIDDKMQSVIQKIPNIDHGHIVSEVKHNLLQDFDQRLEEHSKKTHEHISKHIEDFKQKVDSEPKYDEMPLQKSPLTNPEQKLLNLLLQQPDPISYSKIAGLTGNSVNTVRVVMNNLKKRDVIEETLLPSGEKLFAAKNKEKVKKIYNLQHI